MTAVLDHDQVWEAIDAHRLRVAELLDTLTDDEWDRPSLCDGWTVRDVAAHLTLQQLGWGDALALMLRYRGNTERGIRESARERAARMPAGELVGQIRATVGSRRHNAGVTYRETLIDILVHGQDIAIPLGRTLDCAPAAAATAATRAWTMRWPPPFPATRRMAGFRLTATDVDWAVGAGPEVRGPITAILLVSAGRLAALPRLSGEGAADLGVRLRK